MSPAAQGSDVELAQAAHESMMEVYGLGAREHPHGDVDERDGELLLRAPHPFPFLNNLMRSHTRADADALIARARSWFAERERPTFMAFVRPAGDEDLERALLDAGATQLSEYPEMVCTEQLEVPPRPAGVTVLKLGEERIGADYWEVCNAAYESLGFPARLFDVYAADELIDDAVESLVAYLGGRPVAAAHCTLIGDLGLVGWVATHPDQRRRGLAALLTAEVTNGALAQGARMVSLQASSMGAPVYRRLGYRELYRYRLYLVTAG